MRAGDHFKCGSGTRGVISQSSFYATTSPERTSRDGSSGQASRENSIRGGLRVNLLQRRLSIPNEGNEYTFPPRGGLASEDTFPPRITSETPRLSGDAEMVNIPEDDEEVPSQSVDQNREENRLWDSM